MRIGIHYTEGIAHGNYAHRWIEALRRHDVQVDLVDFEAINALDILNRCDAAMWHFYHNPNDKNVASKILFAFESILNKPVFPNLNTRSHFDNKIAQYYFFKAASVATPKTWVFWQYEEAVKFIDNAKYPMIFKLAVGAGSVNVIKLDSLAEAKRIVDKMFFKGFMPYTTNEYKSRGWRSWINHLKRALKFLVSHENLPLSAYYEVQKNYVYLQEFLPNNNNDIRISVIGNRAFGYIRHNRPGDYRASGSGNFDVDPRNIPLEAVKIAHNLSKRYAFQSMAYDFLLDKNGNPLLTEMSYGFVNWMVHDCPGYWDRDLNWHVGQVWPEDAHVEDFLKYIQEWRKN